MAMWALLVSDRKGDQIDTGAGLERKVLAANPEALCRGPWTPVGKMLANTLSKTDPAATPGYQAALLVIFQLCICLRSATHGGKKKPGESSFSMMAGAH